MFPCFRLQYQYTYRRWNGLHLCVKAKSACSRSENGHPPILYNLLNPSLSLHRRRKDARRARDHGHWTGSGLNGWPETPRKWVLKLALLEVRCTTRLFLGYTVHVNAMKYVQWRAPYDARASGVVEVPAGPEVVHVKRGNNTNVEH